MLVKLIFCTFCELYYVLHGNHDYASSNMCLQEEAASITKWIIILSLAASLLLKFILHMN